MSKISELRIELYGEEHAETVTAMEHLAGTYDRRERWIGVVVFQNSTSKDQAVRAYGDTYREILNAMESLASTYGRLERPAEKGSLEEKILQVHVKLYGK